MTVEYTWRGEVANGEINELHAAAFETRVYSEAEWNWVELLDRHSLGWVTAREEGRLVGFTNVVWDGLVHAWLQDVMVDPTQHRRGIGRLVVVHAVACARTAGCEWLHVDFDDELRPFYIDACGFSPTQAGLIALQDT